MSSTIKRLSPDVASKIAAGEVAERPFNVVKELLENAVDAGASKITVEVTGGGLSAVRISDNGKGMYKDDLPIALERFTTSKVTTVEEVYNAITFGFRGEALAAISSVSDFTLTSGIGNEEAYQIKSFFGNIGEVKPAPPIAGTVVEAINLFENVPARRKFLKSSKSLENEIIKLVKNFALVNPSVEMLLIVEGKEVFRVSNLEDNSLRASKVFTGKGFYKGEVVYDDKKVTCAVTLPSQSDRLKRDAIIIGVNGRLIKDQSLIQAVVKAYYRLIPDGRYPCACVDIRIPPSCLDANVHPAKMEVRFENPSEIFALVCDAVSKAIDGKGVSVASVYSQIPDTNRNSIKFDNTPTVLERELDFKKPVKGLTQVKEKPEFECDNKITELSPSESFIPNYAFDMDEILAPTIKPGLKETEDSFERRIACGRFNIIGQIDKSYIICQTEDKYILFIDQHAAHERILFEKQIGANAMGSKASIVLHEPITVAITEELFEALELYLDIINGFGFACTIDKSSMEANITRIPFSATRRDAGDEFLRIVSDLCLTGKSKTQDAPIALLSCRNAIKAGDPLSLEEMDYLVKLLFNTNNFGTCPHGRPIIYSMSLKELAGKFLR